MRFISLVFILALITTSVALAHGDEHAPATDAVEEEPLVCENCGMLYQPSSTKVDVVAKVDGETAGHIFATMPCLYNHVNFFWDGEAELVTVEVLDYTTYGLKEEKMIDALKAFYLYDTKKLKGTSEPYIAAFATKEALEKAKADLGGEAVDYEEVMKRLVTTIITGMMITTATTMTAIITTKFPTTVTVIMTTGMGMATIAESLDIALHN
ncbi:nitrous oxide reductase accessory protein NosL [bacterium]|nr:nitrous oxide reductase accessory protein NosL [bacterium]